MSISKNSSWPIIKQALLTGITGVLCLYLARYFKLPQGYWAVMSAIIVIQSDVDATIRLSFARVIGTAIGAFVGWIFLGLFGSYPLIFGIAVTIVVYLSMSLKLLESYRIAGVTVAVIMLTSQTGPSWLVALHRFCEVSLGIIVALIMVSLLNPSRVFHILKTKMGFKNK